METQKSYSMLLGKNRKEIGHTVTYNSINNILQELNKTEKCVEGKVAKIVTLEKKELLFNLNANKKAYCGTSGGCLNYKDRTTIEVLDIKICSSSYR